MTWVAAVVAGIGVYLIATARRRSGVSERIRPYLEPPEDPITDGQIRTVDAAPLAWVAIGTIVGALVAQGDLFVAGPTRSVPALMVLGGAAGWVLWSARRSTIRERRIRRMRFELPVLTDALALEVLSGESIGTAIDHVSRSTDGVATEELAAAKASAESTKGLSEALADAARSSQHVDGQRLFETLAHANTAGGRLSESLLRLSTDLRAGLERDTTAEGGKRAVASYGPILALMVPTALLFLLYPTLVGLRGLSGVP